MAQAKEFLLPDLSPKYSAVIQVECSEDECNGPAQVILQRKTDGWRQKFPSADMSILLNGEQPVVNDAMLYGDQSALIVEDFNFDGNADLAIRNGNESSYSGPSYDVYVYHQGKHMFVASEELTELATEHLGMFAVNAKKKRLIVFDKSGCCWHQRTEYAVVPQYGLKMTYRIIEDASSAEGKWVTVTEETLKRHRNGRDVFNTKVRRYPISQYYKD